MHLHGKSDQDEVTAERDVGETDRSMTLLAAAWGRRSCGEGLPGSDLSSTCARLRGGGYPVRTPPSPYVSQGVHCVARVVGASPKAHQLGEGGGNPVANLRASLLPVLLSGCWLLVRPVRSSHQSAAASEGPPPAQSAAVDWPPTADSARSPANHRPAITGIARLQAKRGVDKPAEEDTRVGKTKKLVVFRRRLRPLVAAIVDSSEIPPVLSPS
ncbi:hypothetical protein VTO42DRAFT_4134 [Malbranchea cinnamomea]